VLRLRIEPLIPGLRDDTQILHILTRDRDTAQAILSTALATGFRESGIMNSSGSPMAAIRSNGLALDCIVAVLDADGKVQKLVSDEYIAMLVRIGNLRFEENDRRISKLTKNLEDALFQPKDEGEGKGGGETWEDKEVRKARKREQGLKVQEEARKEQAAMGGSDLRGEVDVDEDELVLGRWMGVGVE
jgi:tRNA wybutosine-synthesizing protein 3